MADETVDALVARGDYPAAAARAATEGDLARAIQLYERIWQFADAVPLARALGDLALAVRLALDAGDVARAQTIAATIADEDRTTIQAAAATFATRGHHRTAAELEARALRWPEAAALFERAGAPLEAARMLERAGRWREAGWLYEGVAAGGAGTDDGADAAFAQLALGRLLGDLGRPLDAARALQAAARHPTTRLPAQERLWAELRALDLPHAAQEIARRAGREGRVGQPGRTASDAAAEATSEWTPLPRRFRVLEALGAGALGRVYAAADELLGRTVALKVLAVGPGGAGPEREAFLRFAREAEAVGRLRHPHIVTLHELDESAGLMVLEHLPGGTLAEAIARRGPLPPASVRRLALEILSGLAAAHRAGLVHRDVKPANILFDAAGNAKLADFGAAHLIDFGHTQTGSFIGTLAYLSPEQITGAPIGFPADLYALGATLFEALTGRPPFQGPDVVGQHLGEAPPRASAARPGLAPAHDEALLRALAKAPGDRYPSAESMAQEIEEWPEISSAPSPTLADAAASAPVPDAPDAPAAPPALDIGPTTRGRLVRVADPRVGREVLREDLDEPLSAEALDTLRGLAAAGGPHVQRTLAIASDGRSITYERLDGDEVTLADLRADEARLLDEAWATLAPLGLAPAADRPVARTTGGPVILVVTARSRTPA